MVHCVFSGFTVIGAGPLAWFQYHLKSFMFCHRWRGSDWYLTRLDAAVFNPSIELDCQRLCESVPFGSPAVGADVVLFRCALYLYRVNWKLPYHGYGTGVQYCRLYAV